MAIIVVIIFPFIVVVNFTGNFKRRFFHVRRILPFAVTVRFIPFGSTVVTVYAHSTVTMIGVERTTRLVDRDLFSIHSKTIALCITIRE